MALHDRIFAAVFPAPTEVDVPTPATTPALGSSAFGEPFGSPSLSQPGVESGAAEQIRWDRAWHTVTTFLTLPNVSIQTDQDEKTLKEKWIKPCSSQTQKAIQYVVSADSRGRQLRKDKDDLLRWYFEEVVLGHYVEFMLPGLVKVCQLICQKHRICLMSARS